MIAIIFTTRNFFTLGFKGRKLKLALPQLVKVWVFLQSNLLYIWTLTDFLSKKFGGGRFHCCLIKSCHQWMGLAIVTSVEEDGISMFDVRLGSLAI
jgi:hypothetical protein